MPSRTPEDVFYRTTEFLNREAAALDDRDMDAWLDLVTDDVEYFVPVRTTRERGDAEREFAGNGYHSKLDREEILARVERAEMEYAWSENPPVRIRHFVTNVRGRRTDDGISARSNVLVSIFDQDRRSPQFLAAERDDVLRETDDGLRLAERTVYLESTAMGIKHLTFII